MLMDKDTLNDDELNHKLMQPITRRFNLIPNTDQSVIIRCPGGSRARAMVTSGRRPFQKCTSLVHCNHGGISVFSRTCVR